MWNRRMVAVVVVLVIAVAANSVPAAAPTAWAGGRDEAILGDVNGDGYRDRVFLGSVQPDRCSVIVQFGRPSGGYDIPAAFVYLRPGGVGPDIPCPDLGVAVDLESDGVDELVVGWFAGPPASTNYTLLVLNRAFQPAFGLTQAIFQPSYLGTADFNGDGRPDVYSVTDQGQGFESYYSLGNGTLTLGPLRWCSGPLTYLLKDFNRDGAVGAVFAYTLGCDDGSNGVVKVSHDGTVQTLEYDPEGIRTWTITTGYFNDDSWADIRATAQDTGAVDTFLQVPGTALGVFVPSPTAKPDQATVRSGQRTAIAVMANDLATTAATLTIVTPPAHGSVQVTSDRRVIYTPHGSGLSSDRFVYRLTEGGKTSVAPVDIRFTT